MEISRLILGSIYTALGAVLVPVASMLFLFFPRGRAHLAERIWGQFPNSFLLIHGASYGEAKGLLPLARLLREQIVGTEIVVTSTSATGRGAAVEAGFTGRLIPFDWLPFYIRAFKYGRPKLVVISETEIWPGLIFYLNLFKIPWILINARISDSSWPWYRAFKFLFRPFLESVNKVLTADSVSIDRFIQLGVPSERVREVGNTKYDSIPKPLTSSAKKILRASLFPNDFPLLILGSIRPGEEKVWFPAIIKLLDSGKKFNVIVAPRHPEKFEYFAESLRVSKIPFTKRSLGGGSNSAVMLLDSLGELTKIYGVGDLAFIGGSIEPFGGHNPLEAMIHATAICMGPSIYVVREVVTALEKQGGFIQVKDWNDALKAIELLLNNPTEVSNKGQIAAQVSSKFLGATDRTMKELKIFL